MEIIEELEPTRRGPYAGAIGYVSFTGNLDTCITIRTILFSRGMAYHPGGGGHRGGLGSGAGVRGDHEEGSGAATGDRLAEEGLG